MKQVEHKMSGEERRTILLKWLKENDEPIKGSTLAELTNVSRQVIVQDISLLKAKNEPILATSQGYLYMREPNQNKGFRRVIACCHLPQQTKEELTIIVDHGVTAIDVTVEHPIYGEITAPLMLHNRRDVNQFLDKIVQTKASLLSELTEGVHLHTLEAESIEQLNETCEALRQAGYLLQQP